MALSPCRVHVTAVHLERLAFLHNAVSHSVFMLLGLTVTSLSYPYGLLESRQSSTLDLFIKHKHWPALKAAGPTRKLTEMFDCLVEFLFQTYSNLSGGLASLQEVSTRARMQPGWQYPPTTQRALSLVPMTA